MNDMAFTPTCIKGLPIDDVKTRTLTELGLPVDALEQPELLHSSALHAYYSKRSGTPYEVVGTVETLYVTRLIECGCRDTAFHDIITLLSPYNITRDELSAGLSSGCVFTLTAAEAKELLDEFLFIIENLLPRQISDLYYSFNIKPNPAHAVFFDLAAAKLGIQRYSNPSNNNYGQFIEFPERGLRRRILCGELFQSIYQRTCATKKMITDAWRKLHLSDFDGDSRSYHLRVIESALFSLSRKYNYSLDDDAELPYFLIRDETGAYALAVGYLPSGKFLDSLAYDAVECHAPRGVPCLLMDYDELDSETYISSIIRNAMQSPEAIEEHRMQRSAYFSAGRVLSDCNENRAVVQRSIICGCFSCGALLHADEIQKWDSEGSAICPQCSNATIIGDAQGYHISERYLLMLKQYITDSEEDFYDGEI